MARAPKFSSEQILNEAGNLLSEGGPLAVNVASVARRVGAPSGSIYHRFSSRDVLVGSLWLRAVEEFQSAIALVRDQTRGSSDPVRAVALGVVAWARNSPTQAHVLLLHRASDLMHSGWPDELRERNAAQQARAAALIDELCTEVGATSATDRRRVMFAVVDLPYAAVRAPLSRGKRPDDHLDELVGDAVTGLLAGLGGQQPTKEGPS